MYYVYALIDPRTDQPFYIGKGKVSNQRHLDHLKQVESSNRHKDIRIKFLKENGYKIKTEILENNILDEDAAYKIEDYYILKYGRMNIDPGGILTNICLGKKPPSWKGRKKSPDHIAKIVESYKRTVSIRGRPPVSDETRRKLSERMKGEKNPFYGKKHSDDYKRRHSARMKGNKNGAKTYRFVSPEGIEHIVFGSFSKFCKTHGLPVSTMEKNMYNKTIVSAGKAKGWFVEKYQIKQN